MTNLSCTNSYAKKYYVVVSAQQHCTILVKCRQYKLLVSQPRFLHPYCVACYDFTAMCGNNKHIINKTTHLSSPIGFDLV